MNELMKWSYEGKEVRTVRVGDETLWVLVDVCDALGLSNPSKVASRLEEDEVCELPVIPNPGLGIHTGAKLVTEPGLYRIIMRSESSVAKGFQRWVTHEVLPEIRKHGVYSAKGFIHRLVTDPKLAIELATYCADLEKEKIALEAKVSEYKLRFDEHEEYATILKYVKMKPLHILPCSTQQMGKLAAQYSRENGYAIGQVDDSRYGTVNAYLIKEVLDVLFWDGDK